MQPFRFDTLSSKFQKEMYYFENEGSQPGNNSFLFYEDSNTSVESERAFTSTFCYKNKKSLERLN